MRYKTHIFAGFLIAGALLATALIWNPFAIKAPQDSHIVIEHFAPAAQLSYSVSSDAGMLESGTLKPQNQMPQIKTLQPIKSAKTLNYKFKMLNAGAHNDAEVSLTLDPRQKKIALNMRGLKAFSDIELRHPLISVKAKADWIGQLKTAQFFDFTQMQNADDYSFEVAFQGADIDGLMRTGSPHIIKVIIADRINNFETGGAPPNTWGPRPPPPNEHTEVYDEDGIPIEPLIGVVYDTTYCGNPELSVCYDQHMAYQIASEEFPDPAENDELNEWLIDNGFSSLDEAVANIDNPSNANILDSGFLSTGGIVGHYVASLAHITNQLTANMMKQAQMIGVFFDAKQNLETQQLLRKKLRDAHKDYHPSEQMCKFGTMVRSLGDTEAAKNNVHAGLNKTMMSIYLGQKNTSTFNAYGSDIDSRLPQFREKFCDVHDNGDGLSLLCDHDQKKDDPTSPQSTDGGGAENKKRINNDLDYAGLIGLPMTHYALFGKPRDIEPPEENVQGDEDFYALARNLYWPTAIDTAAPDQLPQKTEEYTDFRSLIATMGAAHNSFAKLVAMKARSQNASAQDQDGTLNYSDSKPPEKGWEYMRFMMKDLGVSDPDHINRMIGQEPSYWAQMDVLTKKIYQDPDFYTNLYDKPTNVNRISATLDAIKLMHGRDRFEAALRREMLSALLVETALKKHADKTNAELKRQSSDFRGR